MRCSAGSFQITQGMQPSKCAAAELNRMSGDGTITQRENRLKVSLEDSLPSTKQEQYILKVEVETKTLPRFSSWKFSVLVWMQAKIRKKALFFLASHAPRD